MTPALRALRLNLYFPPWRELARHLAAIEVRPPRTIVRRCPRSGWPHPDEWLRVRVDHQLAPVLLERMAHLELPDKRRYLETMGERRPLQLPAPRVSLVDPGPPRRWELVLDRVELALPSFVRWTVRLDAEAAPDPHELRDLLAERPTAEAWRLLQDHAGHELVELVRGELGPVLHEGSAPWLSAVLSRAARGPGTVRVDDPLARDLPVPTTEHGFSLSRQRKWSVPRDDVKDLQRWLAARGSRNLVYRYKQGTRS